MKLVNGDLKVSDTVTEIICVEKSKREALCEDINVSGNLQTTTSKKELDNCKETKEIIAHEPIIHSFKSVPLPAFLSSPIPPPEKTEEIPIQDGKARNICPMPAFILEEKFTPGRNIENFFDKKGRFRKDEPVNTYLARKQIEEGTRKKDSAIETPTDTPTGL
uniref:Uncharacterized protein n=1 Tax=Rhabditophanes sp. KR3021 TaxID=114890 RepID=A0AC35TJ07_9BILA